MIAQLHGSIATIQAHSLIVMVDNIGFEVSVPSPQVFTINKHVFLHTVLQWHQEQGPQLYGFETIQEKIMFTVLITCQGVGPKLALAMLAHFTVGALVELILQDDSKALSAVSGVGKKKAEHIIIALKDKLMTLVEQGLLTYEQSGSYTHQITEVLTSLNYSKQEVQHVMNQLKHDTSLSFDQQLRKALSLLSRKTA